jgi:hypothetical protein
MTQILGATGSLTQDTDPNPIADYVPSWDDSAAEMRRVLHRDIKPLEFITLALSPELGGIATTTTAAAKASLHMPYAFTVTDVRPTMGYNATTVTYTFNVRKDCTEATSSTGGPGGGTSVCSVNPTISGGAITGSAATINSAQAAIPANSLVAVFLSSSVANSTLTNHAGMKCTIVGYRT